jgi:WD40-like Beta Propeller Repeat
VAPGSSARQITSQRGDRAPRWSATGQIVFQRTDIWHVTNPEPRWEKQEELDVIAPPTWRTHEILLYDGEGVDLWPDWSPDGKTVAVDLCTAFGIPAQLPATLPSFILAKDCLPRIWAPDGRRLVWAGFDWGKPNTSCPRYIPRGAREVFVRLGPSHIVLGEERQNPPAISWQPVTAGSLHLHPQPCEPRPEPSIAIESLSGAAPAEFGVQVCVRPRHRHHHHHKRRCVS